MRDVAPLTMTAWFYLYCERLFFGFLDCDCALKNAPIRWCWRYVQFGEEGVQFALLMQFEQGFAHHPVEVGMPPLEFVDGEFHPFLL